MKLNHSSMCWIASVTIAISVRTTLGAAVEPEIDPLSTALIEVTRDPDAKVRRAAFAVLADLPRTEPIVQAFHDGLNDSNGDVRCIALDGLVRLEGATVEVIELLVSRMNDPVTGSTARQGVFRIGEPAVPFLIEAAKHDEGKERAIRLLGETRLGDQHANVVEALIVCLGDEASEIRLEATRSLGKVMETKRKAEQAKRKQDEGLRKFAESTIKTYDKNGDGVLTEEEWGKMRKSLQLADVNRDGRVTAEELVKWLPRQGLKRQ